MNAAALAASFFLRLSISPVSAGSCSTCCLSAAFSAWIAAYSGPPSPPAAGSEAMHFSQTLLDNNISFLSGILFFIPY
jgi:hypothetical protein